MADLWYKLKNVDNLELSNMAGDLRSLNLKASLRIRKVYDKMYDHIPE